MPPTDFVFYKTDLYEEDTTISWKYWISFYTSVFLLVGGEVGPRDTFSASLSSTLIIIGAVITAVMFGEMAVLMTSMNRRSSKFQKILDEANTAMKNMKLPEELQFRIIDYLMYTRATHDTNKEY